MVFTDDETNALTHKLEIWENKLIGTRERIALAGIGVTFMDGDGYVIPIDFFLIKAKMIEYGVLEMRVLLNEHLIA